MDTDFIKGIIPPIITPVTDDERIDEGSLREHIDYMITAGISGILVCGSNSEFYVLEEEEMETVLKITVNQVKGRIPVYLGVGAIRTSKCLRIAKMGVRAGAAGISILQPMFIKPSEDELETHLRRIIGAIPDTPALLYNNPGRTGYPMPQALVERLVHSLPNLAGMKDSSGDLTETLEFIRRNRDAGFKVLVGKDTLIYPGLACGAVGAVCSTANYMPELVCSIYTKFFAGDREGALEAQFTLNPVRLANDTSTFPVATKDCVELRGRRAGKPILPLKPSPPGQREHLREEMRRAGLLNDTAD
jgi:4-hydroxy-tetrahydrodipicolinate synthase